MEVGKGRDVMGDDTRALAIGVEARLGMREDVSLSKRTGGLGSITRGSGAASSWT